MTEAVCVCVRVQWFGSGGVLLFGGEQAESGWFHLCLSEHDGERLDDERAQPEDEWRRCVSVRFFFQNQQNTRGNLQHIMSL